MKSLIRFFLLSLFITPIVNAQTIQFMEKTTIKFASPNEGQKILSTKDDFILALSPFDRAARMKTKNVINEDQLLLFISDNVQGWKNEEIKFLSEKINSVSKSLGNYKFTLPDTIFIIKTSGKEEGGAAYTRQNAIVFPEVYFQDKNHNFENTILHELFHVFSRHKPDIKNQLYQLIGFEKCNEIELPDKIKNIKITNPDAPNNDHYIELNLNGTPIKAVPVLFSKSQQYDLELGGEFFNYLLFKFLVVEEQGGLFKYKVQEDKPIILEFNQMSGFLDQVGRNTQYIIHPEEILADNFAFMVLDASNLPSPEIISKIKNVLQKQSIN